MSAFLQKCDSKRDVYLIPSREYTIRGKSIRILFATSYGLINDNAKWQFQSDELVYELLELAPAWVRAAGIVRQMGAASADLGVGNLKRFRRR